MPDTFPNQKMVIIHRDRPQSDFLQISNEHWMEFNKKYGPFALQLYLYFAKNADNYSLALSQQAAKNEAGITKTTVTRQQMVTLLYRYAKLLGYGISKGDPLTDYVDHNSVADYAKEAVAWSLGYEIISATADGRLNPSAPVTRAQLAASLERLQNAYVYPRTLVSQC